MTPSTQTDQTESGSREPAPGDLAVVQAFINTRELNARGVLVFDELSSPKALEHWLSEHKLLRDRRHLSQTDVAHATSVREALRDLLAANEGQRVGKDAVETLSRAARSAQLLVDFKPDGSAELQPAASGVDAALGELLAVTVRSMLDGSWQRMKACHDDSCRWAFYDRSKNSSSNWCSMRVCGNRAKARKFRKRHA